jgi:hypothetical protein
MGREWTRDHVLSWWAAGDLLEEEREAILDALDDDGVLTETLIQSLGPLAQRRSRARTIASGLPLRIAPSTPEIETAIGSLLSLIRLPSDLRDAGFSPEERDRCQATATGWSSSFLERSLRELRHHSPFWDEFAHTVEKAWRHGLPLPFFTLTGSQSVQDGSVFGVPLVRLLHMRLVLEAPALAGALASPHDHLAPAALLHVLGQDAVTYQPEVRVHQGVERRWRARWAEMSGEALAALVLEDALRLDLTTLTRIPERSDRETPDFMAATRAGEEIVFESKGSTDVATHRRQRRKALAQLGKLFDGEGSKRSRPSGTRVRRTISWKEPGRAFACCFFAAMQGASASSRIHIADPAFGFRDLFPEGWATAARRTHYGAVAEAAGLFDLADDLLQQRRGERPRRGDIESFSFGVGNDQVGRFRGTSTSLGEAARRLRHPRHRLFEHVRMFVGIAEDRFERLTHGDLPGCLDLEATPLVGSGALPAREDTLEPPKSSARGIYSLLSDGSFLAFEVD